MNLPKLLAALTELEAEASLGPWKSEFANMTYGATVWQIGQTGSMRIALASHAAFDKSNCDLIAESRNSLPVLLEALKEAIKLLQEWNRYERATYFDSESDFETSKFLSKYCAESEGGMSTGENCGHLEKCFDCGTECCVVCLNEQCADCGVSICYNCLDKHECQEIKERNSQDE